MKKYLLSLLILFTGLTAFSQTVPSLPVGAKPYGNQLYIVPSTGLIYSGNVGYQYRVVGTKQYVDSLNLIKADVVPTITALKAYTGVTTTLIVQDSLRGGIFNKIPSGLDNNGTVFVANNGNVYKRLYSGYPKPQWFGAKGDGSTLDDAAFTSLKTVFGNTDIDLGGKNFRVLVVPNGNQYVNGTFTLPPDSTDDQPANYFDGRSAGVANTFIPRQFSSSTLLFAAGNFNTGLGANALQKNTIGRRNTGLGSQSLTNNVDGYYNTGVGAYSLFNSISSNDNTSVGNQSMQYTTSGSDNTAMGSAALNANTTGYNNVSVGRQSMLFALTSYNNVAIGRQAMQSALNINNSVAIGYQSMSGPNLTGLYNVMIGAAAGGNLSSGAQNVGIGRRVMLTTTTANNNTAVGNDAMVTNTTGFENTVVGASALSQNSVGSANTAIGRSALAANLASNNTAVGHQAMVTNTTGYENASLGKGSLGNNTEGWQNTALGYNAMSANTTGITNVGIGRAALFANTTGSRNTAVGQQALTTSVDKSNNTAIGNGALSGMTLYTNVTGIGYNTVGTKDNQVVLGNNVVVEVTTAGNYVSTGNGKGVSLNSPDGTAYLATIANGGLLTGWGAATAATGTSTTALASTAFVQQEILANSVVNSTTSALSVATLNSTYPNVKVGYRVICHLITGAPAIYTKATENGSSDVWLTTATTTTP